MTEWAAQYVFIFLFMCVVVLGAIVVRVVRSLERAVRAVEKLAESTRRPWEG